MLERPRRASFHESAGRLLLKLGLLSYALEAPPADVRDCFLRASGHLARALADRQRDPDETRSPYEAETFINLVACFGSEDDHRLIGSLQPWQYRNPEYKAHAAFAQYLAVLVRYIGDTNLDSGSIAKVLAACEATKASKEDRLFLLPSARGLAAVEAGNESEWNYALAQLVAAHAEEARSGDFKLSPKALSACGR